MVPLLFLLAAPPLADAFQAGDWRRAETLARAELAQAADGLARAAALNNLASARLPQGQLSEGEALLREALALAEAASDGAVTGKILSNLGLALAWRGELARAEPVLRRAAWLNQAAGSNAQLALDQHNLGVLLRYDGRANEARQRLEAAEALWRDVTPAMLETQIALAMLDADASRFGPAADRLERARAAAHQAGFARHPVNGTLLANLAQVRQRQGRHAETIRLLSPALAILVERYPGGHPAVTGTIGIGVDTLRATKNKAGVRQAERWKAALKEKPLWRCPEGDERCCETWSRRTR